MMEMRYFLKRLFNILAIAFWPMISLVWSRYCYSVKDPDWKKIAMFGFIGTCGAIDLVSWCFYKTPYKLSGLPHIMVSALFYLVGGILLSFIVSRKMKEKSRNLFAEEVS